MRGDDAAMTWKTALDDHPQILVVCTGNICRSPMGEVVLRDRLERAGIDLPVVSAGVSAEEHGNPIYPLAADVLRAHGYDVPARQAHQVTDAELRDSGLILAMTRQHLRALERRADALGVDRSRLHLWRDFDASSDAPDVPDPWYGGPADFEDTLATVESGADALVAALQ